MFKKLLVSLSILIPCFLQAQLQNQVLQSEYDLRKESIRPEQFLLSAQAYLKNNEYFNLIHPGQTFFGLQVDANYIFRTTLSNKLMLTAGVLAQQDFGDDQLLSKLLPKLTVHFNHKNVRAQVGAIKSHVNHKMHDAMLNYEQALMNPVEYGASFNLNKRNLKYHNWIDWRSLANLSSKTQEEIIFGQTLDYTIQPRAKFLIRLPFQNTIYHKGGQGIAKPIVTRLNAMAGAQIETAKKEIALGYRFFVGLDNSPQIQQPFSQGYAHYSSINSTIKNHAFHLGYWYAYQYTNTLGNPIFSNVNLEYVYANQQARQLVSLRYNFSKNIKNMALIDFRVEPFYDLYTKKIEHSAALFLRVFWK